MKALPVIAFISLSVSCTQSKSSLSQSEKNNIIQEVRQTLSDYYRDIQKEGLLAEFNYLDSSSDFFWVTPGFKTSISFDSVAAILKRNAPMYRSVTNTWDSLRIIPISEEIAAYTGKLHSNLLDTVGKTSEIDLIESGVVIKRDNKWKLLCGQTTLINQ